MGVLISFWVSFRAAQSRKMWLNYFLAEFGMAYYRVCTIGLDGHFLSVEEIECADDQEAIQKAQQAVDDCDVELWQVLSCGFPATHQENRSAAEVHAAHSAHTSTGTTGTEDRWHRERHS
jgi:hypothetical protein